MSKKNHVWKLGWVRVKMNQNGHDVLVPIRCNLLAHVRDFLKIARKLRISMFHTLHELYPNNSTKLGEAALSIRCRVSIRSVQQQIARGKLRDQPHRDTSNAHEYSPSSNILLNRGVSRLSLLPKRQIFRGVTTFWCIFVFVPEQAIGCHNNAKKPTAAGCWRSVESNMQESPSA